MLNAEHTNSFTFKHVVGAYQPHKDVVVFGRTVKQLVDNLKKFLLTLDPKDDEHKKWIKEIKDYFKENKIAYPSNS